MSADFSGKGEGAEKCTLLLLRSYNGHMNWKTWTWLLPFSGALIVYLISSGPTFYWLDSGEFVAAAWTLGIAHPPGHPLPALLSQLFCWLPLGNIAWRVTLACAIEAALATALIAWLSWQLIARLDRKALLPPRMSARLPDWALNSTIIGCALTASWSYAFWFQAIRAEVYSLNVLLLLGIVCCLLKWRSASDRRWLLVAALLVGLSLGNHHFLVFLALPGGLLYLWLNRREIHSWRLGLTILLCAALGLAVLMYLPLRGGRAEIVNWGVPTTPSRFWWVVSARAFFSSVDRAAMQSLAERISGAWFALSSGLGPVTALIAGAGLYLLIRQRETRREAVMLILIIVGNLVSPLLIGFDPYNPDAHGYLAVSLAFLAPGLAVMLIVLGELLVNVGRGVSQAVPLLLCGVSLALAAGQLWRNFSTCDLHEHWAAEENARALLDVPLKTTLLPSHYSSIFGLWALRATSDLRPDVTLLEHRFAVHPGFAKWIAISRPAFAPLAQQWSLREATFAKELWQLSLSHPIYLEYYPELDDFLANNLSAAGLLGSFGKKSASVDNDWRLAQHLARIKQWEAALAPQAGAAAPTERSELETQRAYIHTHYRLADWACRQKEPYLARFHYQAARRLAPASRLLEQLAKSCHLEL